MIIRGDAAASPSRPRRPEPGAAEIRPPIGARRTQELSATRSACGFHLDRAWRVTIITPAAAAWFGVEEGSLIGADVRERLVLPPQLESAIVSSLEAKRASVLACRSSRYPGRWVEYHVEPTAEGATVRFRDAARPPSARRQPQAIGTLGLQNGPGSGIVEIVLLDEQGVIVSGNAAWRATLARMSLDAPLGAVGTSYVDIVRKLFPDLDEAALRQELRDLVAHPSNNIVKTYDVETDGVRRSRQLQMTLLPGRRATRIVVTHEDLSDLASTQAKLRTTREQLLFAQESERQRIAIELHDSTSQHLAALGFGVARLHRLADQVPGVDGVLADMALSLQETMKEVRVLSYLMKPPVLGRDGLARTAARFLKGFGVRSALDVSFRIDSAVDRCSAEVQHAAFRVIQEALSNVHRHAKAAHVKVDLVRRGATLGLQIADDGKGIQGLRDGHPEDVAPGVGIDGMRSRVEQLGGSFDISSRDRGVIVKVAIPAYATDGCPPEPISWVIDRAAS
jgi:two-component system NarL family sensor kinase